MIAALLALALPAGAELVLQVSHSLPVQSVALSADGRLAATAGRDGDVAVWDARRGAKLRTLAADRLGAAAAAFAPDGHRLLVGGAGTAVIWDVVTGRAERRFGEPGEFLKWVAFSPDGRLVYTAGDDDAVKVWNARTGKALARLSSGGGRRLTSAALSKDGGLVAAADGGETLYVWDSSGALKAGPAGGSAWKTVAFLPDGSLASGADEWAAVWDLAKGVERRRVKTAAGRALAASPDGRWLATSGGNTLRLWRARDLAPARALIGHFDSVTSAVFSADGALLLTGAADRTANLWTAGSGARKLTLGGDRLEPLFAAATRLGLLTVDQSSARLWDLSSGKPRRVSAGAWDASCRFAVSADARLLAWTREPGLLDARDLTVEGSTAGWTAPERAEAFALDSRGTLLIAARDGRLEALEPATGRPAGRALPAVSAAWLQLSEDSGRLAAVDDRGEVSAWELPAGRRSASLRAGDSLRPSAALSRDGRLLAAAGARRAGVETRFSLTVRSLDDGRELYNWETDGELRPLAFSADDASLWTLGEGALWRWDLGTGRKLSSVALPAGADAPWPEALDERLGFSAVRVDGRLALLSLETGKELGRLTLTDVGWLLQASDGRVDGSGRAALWVEGLQARPLSQAPGYAPGLLAELLEPR